MTLERQLWIEHANKVSIQLETFIVGSCLPLFISSLASYEHVKNSQNHLLLLARSKSILGLPPKVYHVQPLLQHSPLYSSLFSSPEYIILLLFRHKRVDGRTRAASSHNSLHLSYLHKTKDCFYPTSPNCNFTFQKLDCSPRYAQSSDKIITCK